MVTLSIVGCAPGRLSGSAALVPPRTCLACGPPVPASRWRAAEYRSRNRVIMRPIVAELSDYVARQQAGPALLPAEALISAPRLRILAIKILVWLKEQGWSRRHPLSGEGQFTWCKNLMTLLSELPEWGQLIEGDGQTFDFHR